MKKITLLNDEPLNGSSIGRSDGLGFKTYSEIIAKTIEGTPGPFTIGIFGEWGTGKTSLLKLIEDNCKSNKNNVTVWFNAWMYEKEEHPLLPLISTIIKEIHDNANFWSGFEESIQSLVSSLRAVAYGFSSKSTLKIPGFAEIEASFVAKDMIDRSTAITNDPLLDKAIYYNSFERLSKIAIPKDKKIIIFIDDLDRCFPDKAIKLLESIKLVLSQHGFIFILGVAREVIEGYLKFRYNKEFGIDKFEGQKYLDKIIQLAFPIPPHTQRIADFSTVLLDQLNVQDKAILSPIMPIIGIFCESNPRGTVRFINNLLIDTAISKALLHTEQHKINDIEYFAITRGLQLRWNDIYHKLISSEELCNELNTIDICHINMKIINKNKELLYIIQSANADINLKKILMTSQFKNWISNHNARNFAINFLQTQRSEDDDISFSNNRVRDIAVELNMSSKDLMGIIRDCKIPAKSHMSKLTEHEISTIKNYCLDINRIPNILDTKEITTQKNLIVRRRTRPKKKI
jgi:hypothetical protein